MSTEHLLARERAQQHPRWAEFVARADFLAMSCPRADAAARAFVSDLDNWTTGRSPEMAAEISVLFVVAYSGCSWDHAVDVLKAAMNQRREKDRDGKRRR